VISCKAVGQTSEQNLYPKKTKACFFTKAFLGDFAPRMVG
jgi:hypothetical protein